MPALLNITLVLINLRELACVLLFSSTLAVADVPGEWPARGMLSLLLMQSQPRAAAGRPQWRRSISLGQEDGVHRSARSLPADSFLHEPLLGRRSFDAGTSASASPSRSRQGGGLWRWGAHTLCRPNWCMHISQHHTELDAYMVLHAASHQLQQENYDAIRLQALFARRRRLSAAPAAAGH